MNASHQTVLVTGAAGFAGSHLLEHLQRDGHAEIVAWRRPGSARTVTNGEGRWMDVELLDRTAIQTALAEIRPSAVYHLAGAPHVAQSWQNTRETYEANVLATHHLLNGLRHSGLAPRVLISGSATIYRSQDHPIRENDEIQPVSPYATSKLAQEMLACRAWVEDAVPTLLARSFNHVGPRQDPSFVAPSIARQIALIEAGRLEPVLKVGNLDPRRDVTDVRDTVRGYIAMMQRAKPATPYNVCSGRPLVIGALVKAFVARARRPVQVVQDPSLFRPNDTPLLVGDHSRLTADTGWQPEIPLEQTVDDLLEYWREQIAANA